MVPHGSGVVQLGQQPVRPQVADLVERADQTGGRRVASASDSWGLGHGLLRFWRRVAAIGLDVSSRCAGLSAGVAASAVIVQIGLVAIGPGIGGFRQRYLALSVCIWQAALLQVTRIQSEGAE